MPRFTCYCHDLQDVKESLKQKQAELDQVQKSSGSSDERIKALQV